ncbi:MAG: DnaG [Gemmatimonadetes bacterium]|nr:DnaG [Gemmatimonadota bacterium]
MSMIPDEIIEQVRDAADLVEIIGEAVQLKRTGTDYRGPCPFHGGTNRNFAVIPKKGLYYCFVCHEGGDVFTWLMKRHGLDYPSAVREIARKVGITIPEAGPRQGPDPREPLFQAVAMAADFFARRLQEDQAAAPAREYLAGRDISLEQAGEWGLGFAPRGGELLVEMGRLGIETPVLLEAGLASQRDDGKVVARFRGRLLFPIHDLRGRAVGFGGRILGPGEPKYLNSPDSPVFKKGSLLYHLHLAKQAIRKEETAIVVEGYFDVLRLALAGMENVVAPLGTAMTSDQAGILRRFAKSVVLLYDSDRAGLRATFRAGDECLRHGIRVRVATMPEGEDPDTLVRTGGARAMQAVLHDAVDVLERKLQLLEVRGWFGDVARRRDALDRILPTLRAPADPVVRDLYLGRVVEKVGVSRETLERELRERPAPAGPQAGAVAPLARGTASPMPPRAPRQPGWRIEQALLRVLVASPAWRQRAAGEFTPEDFEVPVYRVIFEALAALPAGADAGDAAAGLAEDAIAVLDRLRELIGGRAGLDLDREYEGAAERLRERADFRRINAVQDPGERRRIMAEWPEKKRERYTWLRARERAERSRQH